MHLKISSDVLMWLILENWSSHTISNDISPSRMEKRVLVWVRMQPQGLSQPLGLGWVGEPLGEPSSAASIPLRAKLHLLCYKQASWSSC